MPKGAQRGVKLKPGSRAEKRDLQAFMDFQNRLFTSESTTTRIKKEEIRKPSLNEAAPASDEDVCDLHFVPNCLSCKKWDENGGDESDDDDITSGSLAAHKLTFEKDRLGKNIQWKEQMEKLDKAIIDPREREKQFLGGKKSRGKSKS